MENKYYTPTIEEFHKGFKFEWEHDSFEKEVFAITTDDDLEIIDDEIREGKIRVKLLDREDIESLGFSQITDDCFNISNVNYRGRTNCDLRLLVRKTILLYIIEPKEITHTIFTGTIKNKSELQKLMIQLGIK